MFGLFKKVEIDDPHFGHLIYKRGGWEGYLILKPLGPEPIPLKINVTKDEPLDALYHIPTIINDQFEALKEQIIEEAVETYTMYQEEELKAGTIDEEELNQYPSANDRDGIWKLLQPFMIDLYTNNSEYNFSISYDVSWWNPHYFVACFMNDKLHQLTSDG